MRWRRGPTSQPRRLRTPAGQQSTLRLPSQLSTSRRRPTLSTPATKIRSRLLRRACPSRLRRRCPLRQSRVLMRKTHTSSRGSSRERSSSGCSSRRGGSSRKRSRVGPFLAATHAAYRLIASTHAEVSTFKATGEGESRVLKDGEASSRSWSPSTQSFSVSCMRCKSDATLYWAARRTRLKVRRRAVLPASPARPARSCSRHQSKKELAGGAVGALRSASPHPNRPRLRPQRR